jgi:hypothetical protein
LFQNTLNFASYFNYRSYFIFFVNCLLYVTSCYCNSTVTSCYCNSTATSCYCNSTVTSFYFVLVLKQTTELKTLHIAHVTQFHNSRPVLSQSVSQSQHRLVFERGSFNLTFVKLKSLKYAWFSPGTFYSPLSTITLMLHTHTLTTVHDTQSHNSTPSLTKTSVCVYLKNINKNPVSSLVFCIQKVTVCYLSLNSCMSLRGLSGNW